MNFPFDAPAASAYTPLTTPAQVAELVDALASGASVRMDVEVRVLSWAPYPRQHHLHEQHPMVLGIVYLPVHGPPCSALT